MQHRKRIIFSKKRKVNDSSAVLQSSFYKNKTVEGYLVLTILHFQHGRRRKGKSWYISAITLAGRSIYH